MGGSVKTLAVLFSAAGVAFALSGCGPSAQSAQPVSTVQIKDDPFKSEIEYQGQEVMLEQDKSLLGFPMGTGKECLLRAWKNKTTGAVTYQLYMVVTYDSSGWRLYNSATLKGGHPATFISIDRQVQSCSAETGVCGYEETFAANFSDAELRSMEASGLSVEAHSKAGGDDVFAVSPEYIRNFVTSVNGQASQ